MYVGYVVKFVVFKVRLVFWLQRIFTWKTLGGKSVFFQGRHACGLHSKESVSQFNIFKFCLESF